MAPVILYCVMAYKVIESCTGAMASIPSKVLTWVSLRGHEEGHDGIDKHVNAVGGVIKGDTKAMFAGGMGKSATKGDKPTKTGDKIASDAAE